MPPIMRASWTARSGCRLAINKRGGAGRHPFDYCTLRPVRCLVVHHHHAAGSTHRLNRRSMKLRRTEAVTRVRDDRLLMEPDRRLIGVEWRERFHRPGFRVGDLSPQLRIRQRAKLRALQHAGPVPTTPRPFNDLAAFVSPACALSL